MVCHIAITKESPDLQKLRNFAKRKQEIVWVRQNKVSDWVFWSHRTHLEANVTCESCHGPVASMVVTTMGGCVSCHQQSGGPTGCLSCHEGKH
jgi:protein-arginine kinase activator protein McsA